MGTKGKHHRHLALSLPAVSDDAQRSNDGLGSVQDALTAPLHPAFPVTKPWDEEARSAHPARDRAASWLNQEPKGKGKPGPALSHAQSRFLGRIEGRAGRSISCSVACPRTPPQPPLLPSQLIDMRLGIQSHFWLPESEFHTAWQKVKNVHFWTELSLRNHDKVTV